MVLSLLQQKRYYCTAVACIRIFHSFPQVTTTAVCANWKKASQGPVGRAISLHSAHYAVREPSNRRGEPLGWKMLCTIAPGSYSEVAMIPRANKLSKRQQDAVSLVSYRGNTLRPEWLGSQGGTKEPPGRPAEPP